MAIPVSSAASPGTDQGSGTGAITASGQNSPEQGGAANRAGEACSFFRLLQGASGSKDGQEVEQGDQAQASASLRLLALLFQLQPGQLAELTSGQAQSLETPGGAARSGQTGSLMSLLQDLGGEGEGLKALSRLLAGGGTSGDSQVMTELRGLLEQLQGGRGETEQSLSRLLSLMREGARNGESFAMQGAGDQERSNFRAEGDPSGRANSGADPERLLRLALSRAGHTGASAQGGDVGELAAALRNASEQGRLSGEQLQRIAKDLLTATASTSGSHRSGAEGGQIDGLAAAMQRSEGDNGQSRINLARLFLESFGRGERAGQDGGRNSASGQEGRNFLNQDKSLLQSLVRPGDGKLQATEVSSPSSSGGNEGSHSGVSLKAGQFGTFLSSARGAADAGLSGAASRASQAPGGSNVMDNQVLQQVVGKFQTELQRGASRMSLRMHPPELGRVHLKLVSDDSSMQVQLQVQNTQVQSILERNMPALRQALEQQNIDFDSIQVSVESGSDEGSQRYSRERDPDFSPRRGWNGYPEAEADPIQEVHAARPASAEGISLRV